MSKPAIKITFFDITKRQVLQDSLKEQFSLIKINFEIPEELMKDLVLIFKTQDSSYIHIDDKEFLLIKERIITGKVKGTVKFELVDSEKMSNIVMKKGEDNNNGKVNVNVNRVSNTTTDIVNTDINPCFKSNIFPSVVQRDTIENSYAYHNYEENQIQEILKREMELIQSSILSTITNTVNSSKIFYANNPGKNSINHNKQVKINNISNINNIDINNTESVYQEPEQLHIINNNKNLSTPLKLKCDQCGNINTQDYIFYCSNHECNNKKVCADCEMSHYDNKEGSSVHILIKSYKELLFKNTNFVVVTKNTDNTTEIEKSVFVEKDYSFHCSNHNIDNTFIVKQGKDYTLNLSMINNGNKDWKKRFEICCAEESDVFLYENIKIPTLIKTKQEIEIEAKFNLKECLIGKYMAVLEMRTDKGESFGNKIRIRISVS